MPAAAAAHAMSPPLPTRRRPPPLLPTRRRLAAAAHATPASAAPAHATPAGRRCPRDAGLRRSCPRDAGLRRSCPRDASLRRCPIFPQFAWSSAHQGFHHLHPCCNQGPTWQCPMMLGSRASPSFGKARAELTFSARWRNEPARAELFCSELKTGSARAQPELACVQPYFQPTTRSTISSEQEMDMEIPVIDLDGLNGDAAERTQTMARLHQACKDWGFFWVDSHGVDSALMEEVKRFVYGHYDDQLEDKFYASGLAKDLQAAVEPDPEDSNKTVSDQVDWESAYFIRHHPNNNVPDFPEILPPTREVLDTYIAQMVSLAERLAECMSVNLGLDCARIKDTFAPPFVGTKFAMYPACPRPDLVWGLRAHTDTGGIILLLQDDVVGGLEFFRGDREWVPVGPTKGSRIFVNIGDQVEVMSGGVYRSVLHRVAAGSEGRRLSVATFYNPGMDAVVAAPVTAVQLYPGAYSFGDYLDYYQATKFADKAARFQAVKELFG